MAEKEAGTNYKPSLTRLFAETRSSKRILSQILPKSRQANGKAEGGGEDLFPATKKGIDH